MLKQFINSTILGLVGGSHSAPAGLAQNLTLLIIPVLFATILILVLVLFLQRRTRNSLEESQSILKTTLENTPDAVLVFNHKGLVTHYNAQFRRDWRIPDSQNSHLLGQVIMEYLLALLRFPNQVLYHWENDGTELAEAPQYLHLKDGRILEWFSVPLSANGIGTGKVWIFRDLTRQKKAQARLQESQWRLRQAQILARMGNWELDLETGCLGLSAEAARIWGHQGGEIEMTLKQMQTHVCADDRDRVSDAFHQLVHTGVGFDLEFRLHPPGSETFIWVHSRAALYRDADRSPRMILGTLQNISDRRQMENERNAMQMKLVQGQKMEAIGSLAGGIAHDFNNILAAIMGYAEVAKIHIREKRHNLEDLEKILAAGRRARDLINQILAFSRQDSISPRNMTLKSIIEEAIKLLRPTLPATIEIRTEIETEGLVLADPTQIHQVLMNLCTNAYQAMQHTGGILTIRLAEMASDTSKPAEMVAAGKPEKGGPYVRLQIADTGQGIEAHALNRIWEPFFTTKADGEGTGMGLSMVHGIVTKYGGCITVSSEKGRGTLFEVWLPASERQDPLSIPLGRQMPTGTEHILLIDDEPLLIDSNRQLLTHLGYRVSSFTDSAQALDAFNKTPNHFDLVITDLTMPHMKGDELAYRMLTIRPELPVIIYSGDRRRASLEKSRALGVHDVIAKPIPLQRLARVVRDALDGAQHQSPATALKLVGP